MEDLTSKCLWIAEKAHERQFRRNGKTPYIEHVHDVANRACRFGQEYTCVAYLHDVLEDSHLTTKDLIAFGVPKNIVDAVELLTKHNDENYDEYLYHISFNELARRVKICDMISNLADDPTDKQILKYGRGLSYLMEND